MTVMEKNVHNCEVSQQAIQIGKFIIRRKFNVTAVKQYGI
jgi:hypothetical protein